MMEEWRRRKWRGGQRAPDNPFWCREDDAARHLELSEENFGCGKHFAFDEVPSDDSACTVTEGDVEMEAIAADGPD
eukprot:CAMPEP_0177749026 /NCGR_PEP_ID=MMETSP0484_2-20121128/32258_1 /TAXON_ID=354590 /ORGANISM="Rhodomonas lens, Strain RHODO" /LENGTH=75 /DNA_ID=CAMNT_0019263965 /DNA_START=59 /DNA_END=287 /DNA_ORIENTATION=+